MAEPGGAGEGEHPPQLRTQEVQLTEISPGGRVGATLGQRGVNIIESHREWTRVAIAGGLTFLYALSIGSFFYRVLFNATELSAEHLDAFKTSFALLSSTYGVIIGFYFGASRQTPG